MSLNPAQFPDMPRDRSLPVVQPHGTEPAAQRAADLKTYGGVGGAHSKATWGTKTPFGGKNAVKNPIPAPDWDEAHSDASKDHNVVVGGATKWEARDEFVPTWRIRSPQDNVNPDAIAHQIANADPQHLTDRPDVVPYLGKEAGHDADVEMYDLNEGNHRVNAALGRGQLFMQAAVSRTTGYLRDEAEGRTPR